jgi:two-component system CheB/CheR fusion protein
VPLQMNQLFSNLLSNALKFIKPSISPVIQVTSRLLTPEEVKLFPSLIFNTQYWEITFTDNGIGFDQRFSEQMFLIFHRLNPRKDFEGTGIGLALCRGIVTNHHGEIYANSRQDEGTQFHVILPIEQ